MSQERKTDLWLTDWPLRNIHISNDNVCTLFVSSITDNNFSGLDYTSNTVGVIKTCIAYLRDHIGSPKYYDGVHVAQLCSFLWVFVSLWLVYNVACVWGVSFLDCHSVFSIVYFTPLWKITKSIIGYIQYSSISKWENNIIFVEFAILHHILKKFKNSTF